MISSSIGSIKMAWSRWGKVFLFEMACMIK
jgi:hypothetical protein